MLSNFFGMVFSGASPVSSARAESAPSLVLMMTGLVVISQCLPLDGWLDRS
jgi:hypothetical protein